MTKEVSIVIISKKEELDDICNKLNSINVKTSHCKYCDIIIINQMIEREPKNFFEKIRAFFSDIKYEDWCTNFGGICHDKTGIYCDDIKCLLSNTTDYVGKESGTK